MTHKLRSAAAMPPKAPKMPVITSTKRTGLNGSANANSEHKPTQIKA